jgi:sacsin
MLLGFFSLAFGVRHGPDSEDYCKLWGTWERSVHELDISYCSSFWTFIATSWSKNTQKLLSGRVKVPVGTDPKVTLMKKEDVLIPDDQLVTDLFKKLPQQSLFIWYPPSAIPSMSRARLNSIYDSIGVQRISKSVMKNDSFTLENGRFRTVDSSKVIKVGLLRIILVFLADPALDIPAEGRHRMVSCLLNVTVQENDEPITVGYSVSLSSGEVVNVKVS